MNEVFNIAWKYTMMAEGGYVSDIDDPGGETKFGISKKSFPGEDIKNLTIERARAIAYTQYWEAANCDALVALGFPLTAISTFDAAYHCGITTARKLIQKYTGVRADGKLGPLTYASIRKHSDLDLCIGIIFEREDYFDAVTAKNDKLLKYDKGWERRIIKLIVTLVEEFYTRK